MTAAALQTNPHNAARTALDEHIKEKVRRWLRLILGAAQDSANNYGEEP